MNHFFNNVVLYGNKGCSGGNREATILYILDNGGIDTAKSYPYTGSVSDHISVIHHFFYIIIFIFYSKRCASLIIITLELL